MANAQIFTNRFAGGLSKNRENMNDVKLKIYGFLSLSKSQYLLIQTCVFFVLLVLFIFGKTAGQLAAEGSLQCYLDELALIVAILEVFETFIIFKKFKKAATVGKPYA